VLTARVIDPKPANMLKFREATYNAEVNVGALEDDIYDKAFQIIRDVLDFRELDPEDPKSVQLVVDRWVREGQSRDEAEKRVRLAKSGWNKPSEMAAGVKLAQETFVGITKARSKQPVVHAHFSAEFKLVPAPQTYPELLEETDE